VVDGNVSEVGVMVTPVAPPVAVPLRATVCGELLALSVACRVAVRFPATTGLKLTVTTHDPPTARLLPQALVCTNELASVPVMLMPVSASAAVPELLSVTVAVFVPPTAVDP
jgi:hypothetical protein